MLCIPSSPRSPKALLQKLPYSPRAPSEEPSHLQHAASRDRFQLWHAGHGIHPFHNVRLEMSPRRNTNNQTMLYEVSLSGGRPISAAISVASTVATAPLLIATAVALAALEVQDYWLPRLHRHKPRPFPSKLHIAKPVAARRRRRAALLIVRHEERGAEGAWDTVSLDSQPPACSLKPATYTLLRQVFGTPENRDTAMTCLSALTKMLKDLAE